MALQLTPESQAKLQDLALRTQRDASELLEEAVEQLFEYDEWFENKIRKSIAAARGSQIVLDEEVAAWRERGERTRARIE